MKTMIRVALIATMATAACSDGNGENTAERSLMQGDGVTIAAPRDVASGGGSYQHEAGGLELGPGVEVAAHVTLPNGNTAFFIVAGDSWTISETGPVGNVPVVDQLIAGISTPVEQFQALAPGQEVPSRIAALPAPGLRVSSETLEEKQATAARFEELKRQAEAGELGPSGDGLNAHNGSCGASWFASNICIDFVNDHGNSPDVKFYHYDRTSSDSVVRSAWNGQAAACSNEGTVTLAVSGGGYSYSVSVLEGHWNRSGAWSNYRRTEICSAWSCETIYVSTNTSAQSSVSNVSGADYYHWCGWMDTTP